METHKKLERQEDGMLGGVCAGIAEYLNMDVTIVRLFYVIISVCSTLFPGTLVYIVLWIVMPKATNRTSNLQYKGNV